MAEALTGLAAKVLACGQVHDHFPRCERLPGLTNRSVTASGRDSQTKDWRYGQGDQLRQNIPKQRLWLLPGWADRQPDFQLS